MASYGKHREFIMRMASKKRNLASRRTGAAVVEFAIVAPLMIMFTFGLIEIGRISMVKQTATHASREGARAAVHPLATQSSVEQRVDEELMPLSLDNATVEIDPGALEAIEPGELVTVRVRIDISTVSWIPGFFNFAASEIVSESTMRRESTE
ncbi:MAG: pilus assembly protein [Pirellulaceae bacterium]|nr:pilus assembly protein [Pirellulaceae bacterium]